jgi:D-arabinose 1-dehydrogenase-like Zn-dependent alcohol dehydrogenase
MADAMIARGVIAREPNQPGVIEEFTIPAPGPNEARVRILASGVCHTDLSAKNGVFGTDYFPFLLGHEGSAIVESVGEGVTNVKGGRLRHPRVAGSLRRMPLLPRRQATPLCRQPQCQTEDDYP